VRRQIDYVSLESNVFSFQIENTCTFAMNTRLRHRLNRCIKSWIGSASKLIYIGAARNDFTSFKTIASFLAHISHSGLRFILDCSQCIRGEYPQMDAKFPPFSQIVISDVFKCLRFRFAVFYMSRMHLLEKCLFRRRIVYNEGVPDCIIYIHIYI